MHQYEQPAQQKQIRHGQAPDAELLNGPVVNRGCTDILCLLIYIGCTGFMIYIAYLGFTKGDPMRLTYPYDPDGRACGHQQDVISYPYIYMVSPYIDHFNRSVCVSSCPNWVNETNKPTSLSCINNSVVTDCQAVLSLGPKVDIQNLTTNNILQYLNGEYKVDMDTLMNYSTFIYNSTPFLDRICFPDGKEYYSMIGNMTGPLHIEYMQEWVHDVITVWKVILASAGIALLIGLVYMVLMRFCSGLLTWLGILLYFVSLVLLIIFIKNEAENYQKQADLNTTNGVQDKDNNAKNSAQALKILCYCLIAVACLSFIAFICYFTRIRLAIAVIKSASLYIMDEPWALLIPPIFAVISILFWAFWIASFVYIYSVGDIKGRRDSPFASITWTEDTRRMVWFFLFMGLWENALIQAICGFILASSCCIWYFSQGQGQNFFQFPILISVKRAIFNHLGSLAVGSFLLAVVQFIRIWLEYINYQVSQLGDGQKPQPLKCFIDCLRCYAACFERFVSFLNKNAYIQIALTGKSFFPAAKDGFFLIETNLGKFAIVNGIGGIFTAIGKLFVAFVSTYICYIIITKSEEYKNKLSSPFLPLFLFFVISYVIGALFMMIYGMSIDSILQCSIVDEDINKRNGQQPKYCPQPLKDFYSSQ